MEKNDPPSDSPSNPEVNEDTADGGGHSLLKKMRDLQLAAAADTPSKKSLDKPADAAATAVHVQEQATPKRKIPQRLLNQLNERKQMQKYNSFVADLVKIDLINAYRNDSPKRGFCIIINQKEFAPSTGQGRREGTDVDADDVEIIFAALGFDVGRFNDLTMSGLSEVTRFYSQKNHSAYDMFVMIVLSHGVEGRVYMNDGVVSIEDDLIDPFRGANCLSLVGKPKLFFIQACRGHKCDSGVTVTDSAKERIPHEADILVFQSTVRGYFSWRNNQDGSWFIQSLCYVLHKYVIDYDPASGEPPKSLDELITLTKQIVAIKFESNTAREERSHKKEMPVVVSTLRKAFYFNPLPWK